ncbi:MAG: hypothetical protein ACI4RP_01875 [Acutalibacteraceae bacterium]
MNNEKNQDIKSRLSKLLKDDKIKKLIIVLCIGGIALIFLSTFFGGAAGSQQDSQQSAPEGQVCTNLSEYKKTLETDLKNIISKIDGVGTADIFLTLDSGSESVYAVNKKQDTSTGENKNDESIDAQYCSLRKSDGSESGMLLKIIEPDVRGVLVVCDGGDSSTIKERVLEAVTKALNISSARVCVTKSSQ